jgi:hypothetical protein
MSELYPLPKHATLLIALTQRRHADSETSLERKFLGVYFRIGSGGDLTELLAKNIGPYRKKTVLTESEWRGLNLKIWGELPEY